MSECAVICGMTNGERQTECSSCVNMMTQKGDDGQGKLSMWRLSEDRKHVESLWQGIWAPLLPSEVVKALKEYEHDRNKCRTDHCDAQQFRERVRVLSEALNKILDYLAGPNGLDVPPDYKHGGEYIWGVIAKALPYPPSPVATEGGEGA